MRLSSRRQFLGGAMVAAAASSAGCLGVFAGDGDSDPDSRKLQLTLSRIDGPLHERYVVESDDRPERWADGAMEAAIADEAFTIEFRKPFFARPDDPVYVHHDDAYYELGSVVVDEVTSRRPILRLFATDDDADTETVVPVENLPERDRNAVEVAHMAARARGNEGGIPHGLVVRGGYVDREGESAGESVLLGDGPPQYVRYRDTVSDVSISRETFHEPVYRATADPVATSTERMEAILRARFVDARFERDDLTRAARDVVRDATGHEPYRESHPYSAGFEDLLTAMHERPYLDGNVRKDAGRLDGTGTIRYDGTYYDYSLRFVGDSIED